MSSYNAKDLCAEFRNLKTENIFISFVIFMSLNLEWKSNQLNKAQKHFFQAFLHFEIFLCSHFPPDWSQIDFSLSYVYAISIILHQRTPT